MEERVASIISGSEGDLVWLLEHPPLYTSGTSAKAEDLLDTQKFPVYEAGRGGQYTYHGPGQRIGYVMLDLKKREKQDVRAFIYNLEEWLINTIAQFGITGQRREGRVGIWVECDGTEKKIAAIGVRLRKWVTYHGVALNINPELSHFSGIVPCGISQYGVTSLCALGVDVSKEEIDKIMQQEFNRIFN